MPPMMASSDNPLDLCYGRGYEAQVKGYATTTPRGLKECSQRLVPQGQEEVDALKIGGVFASKLKWM